MSERIIVLDEQQLLAKIQEFPDQLEKSWASIGAKSITIDSSKIKRLLVCGMGGSGIAGALVRELALPTTALPFETWADYGLPGWVDGETLVVAVSYSGETEEILDVVRQALTKQALVVVITANGKLRHLAQTHALPHFLIDYQSTPRSSLGWQYGLLFALLTRLKIADFEEETYFQALQELRKVVSQKLFLPKAEELAITLSNKVPVILAHWPLVSVARRWQTQFNENAKTFAYSGAVPEICHNFLVGLDFAVQEKLIVLFIESSYGFSRNLARKRILEKIFQAKGIPFVPLSVKSATSLAEQWLLLYFGDLLSYYLAGVYGVDPTPTEVITTLKQELTKL